MKKYIIVILSFLTVGCYEDTISPDLLQDYREKMVVNAVLTSGELIELSLTNSLSAIDTNGFRRIQGSNIKIETSSGSEKIMNNVSGDMNYVSDLIANAGENLSIKIKHPDFTSSVTSTVAFPNSVGATATLTVDGGLDTSGLPGDLIDYNPHPRIKAPVAV